METVFPGGAASASGNNQFKVLLEYNPYAMTFPNPGAGAASLDVLKIHREIFCPAN